MAVRLTSLKSIQTAAEELIKQATDLQDGDAKGWCQVFNLWYSVANVARHEDRDREFLHVYLYNLQSITNQSEISANWYGLCHASKLTLWTMRSRWIMISLCIYIVGSESTFVTIRSLMPIRCLMKHFRDFQRMVWALISNQTVWMHRLILVNTSRWSNVGFIKTCLI